MYLRTPRKMILFIYSFIFYLVSVNCNRHNTDVIMTPPASTYYTYYSHLIRGSSVNTYVGPEKAAYCKLVSPRGIVFYDGLGSCRLSLDRVALEHDGYWQMLVGFQTHATVDLEYLRIHVIQPYPKTTVETVVEESSPKIMTVTCSLPSGYHVRGCKFTGPHDTWLWASETREYDDKIADPYNSRFESRLNGSQCGFRIFNPEVRDLGFWRCAMYTEQETYYGFVTVLSSWFLDESSIVDAIRRGPKLRVDNENIDVYKGEPATVLCSIEAPISYCYFWSSDGTVINVSPGLKTSSVEYNGAGFDAGECGLKFLDLDYMNRRWSCHVGLATGDQKNHDFWIGVYDRFKVSQSDYGATLGLAGKVDGELEYCRFVNDGGFGFMYNHTLPYRYTFVGSLSRGSCDLQIQYPDPWSDYSPWTIVAKVRGEDEEISGRTRGLKAPVYYPRSYGPTGWQIFGWVLLSVVIAAILLGVSLYPERNRRWVARRATIVRESFRRSRPPPYTPTS